VDPLKRSKPILREDWSLVLWGERVSLLGSVVALLLFEDVDSCFPKGVRGLSAKNSRSLLRDGGSTRNLYDKGVEVSTHALSKKVAGPYRCKGQHRLNYEEKLLGTKMDGGLISTNRPEFISS